MLNTFDDDKSDSQPEEFLGAHTCVPELISSSYAPEVFFGNNKLPPYCITTGNGMRVKKVIGFFDKGTGIILREKVQSYNINPARIEIAVGLYKGTPITVFEHQIGPSATEIYVRELLSKHCMSNKFTVDTSNKVFNSDAKYIFRVGTALGINNDPSSSSADDVKINLGDIVICSRQVGISSVDFQASTSNLNMFSYKSSIDKAKKSLKELGYKFHTIPSANNEIEDEEWPILDLDENITNILAKCVEDQFKLSSNKKTRYKCRKLGNVSKDSLYAEEAPKAFVKLRKHLNVGSSEMEFATILRVAKYMKKKHDNDVKVGLSSMVVGTIPGASFSEFDRSISYNAQWISALEALHQISLKHIAK